MKDWIGTAWDALTKKLGALNAFLRPIAREIEIGVKERDKSRVVAACDAMDSRTHETREACDASDDLTAYVRTSLEDDNWTALEAGNIALKVQRLIDELEDIATGHDEDDEPVDGGQDDPPGIHQP
jgi:hypothetical protein